MLFDAGARVLHQAGAVPARFRDPDDGHIEHSPLRHRVQRGKDLLERKVAGGPEEHQRIAVVARDGSHFCQSLIVPICMRSGYEIF